MEDLMVKLVKTVDSIRAITTVSSEGVAQREYEACRDILNCLIDYYRRAGKLQWSEHHLQKMTKVTQSLLKTLRVLKQQRVRMADFSKDGVVSEDSLMHLAQNFINAMSTENHYAEHPPDACTVDASRSGLPSTVQEYKHRLVKHSKELHKNPPALPPDQVVVIETNLNILPCPPRRDSKTMRLTFFTPFEEGQFKKNGATKKNVVVAEFHPNVTPEEVLLEGAFGGTYFRNIHSAVTNVHYIGTDVIHETLAPEWISKYDAKLISTKLTSSTYRNSVNKYKVKCGGSLGMWESSGWISDADPYGWFQWYCRFYRGRRSSDDARQISRWKALAGTKGRFKSQLCNKILNKASNMSLTSGTSKQTRTAMVAAIKDESISPVVRQTLFHWGLEITEEVMELHERSQKR